VEIGKNGPGTLGVKKSKSLDGNQSFDDNKACAHCKLIWIADKIVIP
jgi:hypothetical protein